MISSDIRLQHNKFYLLIATDAQTNNITPRLDYTKSVTVAGKITVFVYLRDTTKAADVNPTWIRVRNVIADIKADFSQGVIGSA